MTSAPQFSVAAERLADLQANLAPGTDLGRDLAAIFIALPQPLLVVDAADRLRLINPAAEEFLRHSKRAMEGVDLARALPEAGGLIDAVAQARSADGAVTVHDAALAGPGLPSGGITVRACPVAIEAGAVLIEIQRQRDVADEALDQTAEGLKAASIASVLGHEIRNPLLGIRGATQLLDGALADKDRHLLQLIRDEADRIAALIADIEKLTGGEAVSTEALNIHEAVLHAKAIAEAGVAAHVRIVTRFDPSLPPAAADRSSLIQAILNLITNAAEALPQNGGEITLRTAWRQSLQSRHPQPLLISVSDNGPGIPAAIRHTVFEPFVSTKAGGRGLGLAMVARIVAAHGGTVALDPLDRGTRFTIGLPLWSEA